ncbi:metallophosphoesterase [Oecophyllibacter saccharovorans]|uniref:Phosphatase n=1 Tax=Oecophyllibacter saccharovorans TaxID=2558360 RepID=A0A506UQX7_9PROT|nr:metallophosphoesterase [Oecophyllibacter saccharovorans]QDH14554.1 phosphatase [Oecophyllibacter saccharovorans]TPW34751.1 phosphatase [Oecophyllibacter saccharovorans]TPW35692.1 phosphatase [Oecophyllibacter saccharovorans]
MKRIREHGLRVVGDVHGDLTAFRHAIATERYVIQLGDLVDHGPDSAGVLEHMLELLETQRGMFVLGNHDRKLGRALEGRRLRRDQALEETLQQLGQPHNLELAQRAYEAIARAPAWQRIGNRLFVHGGFHTAMLNEPPPATGLATMSGPLSRALFGETTGRMQPDGYPERLLNWINRIPPHLTVYVGHDRRSTDGRPWSRTGRQGGEAIFMDLGAGKGGHLAWVDLNEE